MPIMKGFMLYPAVYNENQIIRVGLSCSMNNVGGASARWGAEMKNGPSGWKGPFSWRCLAEGVGFEPTKAVKPCRFSRPVHSTALPALRARNYNLKRRARLRTSQAYCDSLRNNACKSFRKA